MDSLRPPDNVSFFEEPSRVIPGARTGDTWSYAGTEVRCRRENDHLAADIHGVGTIARRVILRWNHPVPACTHILGDHWERGYGDLAWRGFVPERVLPWYVLLHAGGRTTGWGVRTGAAAFCFWQVDPNGVALWLDLRCGTEGARLNGRTLRAAEIVVAESHDSPFAAATAFCRRLCPNPRLPQTPVYGGNDWYYAYRASTHETLVRDSARLSRWAGAAANRPFSVIDDGWQARDCCNDSPWTPPHSNFPDMARLAREIRNTGCRPGLWIRPLLTFEDVAPAWRLDGRPNFPREGSVLDPSVPEVLEKIRRDLQTLTSWGYELIKHDFTTFDLLMKWGFAMGADLTEGTWKFHDDTRTTAEIIGELYRAIRQGAGDALVLGCNTVGHLAAGWVEVQRTGDDTSGRQWERTRRMGVNTLAFRMPQHGTFFAADADCVGLTPAVPWEMNRAWLELVAASGTPLFVSAALEAVGPEQDAALREAFALAAQPREPAEPLDWMETTCPQRWKIDGQVRTYDWFGTAGALPFLTY